MSEILEGPVERIIVETKEAPAPVGPYSQVGRSFKIKYPEIEGEKEAGTFVTLYEVPLKLLSDRRRKCFFRETGMEEVNRHEIFPIRKLPATRRYE